MERWESKLVKDRALKEYFINPEGKIRKWKGTLKELDEWTSTHALIASKIVGTSHGRETDTLHKLGWIAMGSAVYGNRIKNEPTQAQINTLYDLGFWRICDDSGKIYNFNQSINTN